VNNETPNLVAQRTRVPLQWFFPAEAACIEAIAARIIPGTPDDPGALEADALVYIDRALAGAYSALRSFYRRGISCLDAYATTVHGAPFAQLPAATQDLVLRQLEADNIPTFPAAEPDAAANEPTAATFFAVVRQHTIEGMFADPMYGGNRNAVGWRLIGYPGPRFGFSRAEMQPGADLAGQPVTTLADLRDFYDRGDDRDRRWGER
jgi:gluconate 2-dehydrogenase gamma chain